MIDRFAAKRAGHVSLAWLKLDAPLSHPEPHPGRGSGVELWLARHAEVHEDWRGKVYGNLDVPLSADGLARTRELAGALAGLPPAAVCSSPLERAWLLGRALAEASGAPLAVEAALAEIDRGRWQGRSVEALQRDEPERVRALYADPWRWREHGGESDACLAARAWPAVEALLERHADGAVVVTTHYNVIRVIVSAALGIAPARSFGLRIDPGRAALLADAPDGWRLCRSNVYAPASPAAIGGRA